MCNIFCYCYISAASSVYIDENTLQSQPDSTYSEGSMTINEDSNMSFPDNSNFSQSQDQDSTEADMRLGRFR